MEYFFTILIGGFFLFLINKNYKKEIIKNREEIAKISEEFYKFQKNANMELTRLANISTSRITENNIKNLEHNQKNYNDLSKKIDELNGKFHGMANWFALPQSVSQEEKEKFNISIESLLEDYKTLALKNFKEKYSNYKVIGLENADLIRVNRNLQPNFSEIATGKYLAIELENSIYSVYLQKNLNLYDDIFDGIGVTFIFEFDIEPLKGFTYGDWKLVKPAVFQHMTNNRWLCMEKGKIILDPENLKEKEVLPDIKIDDDTEIIKDELPIDSNKEKSNFKNNFLNEIFSKKKKVSKKSKPIKELPSEALSKIICEQHNSFSSPIFLKKYPEHEKISYLNQKFSSAINGNFIAINFSEMSKDNYLVLYPKNTDISMNSEVNLVFELDDSKSIKKNWKITKPSLFKKENDTWILIEKGKIVSIDDSNLYR